MMGTSQEPIAIGERGFDRNKAKSLHGMPMFAKRIRKGLSQNIYAMDNGTNESKNGNKMSIDEG